MAGRPGGSRGRSWGRGAVCLALPFLPKFSRLIFQKKKRLRSDSYTGPAKEMFANAEAVDLSPQPREPGRAICVSITRPAPPVPGPACAHIFPGKSKVLTEAAGEAPGPGEALPVAGQGEGESLLESPEESFSGCAVASIPSLTAHRGGRFETELGFTPSCCSESWQMS